MKPSRNAFAVLISLAATACGGDGGQPVPVPDETCMGPWVRVDPVLADLAVGDSVAVTANRHPIILTCSPGVVPVFEWRPQVTGLVQVRTTGDSTAVIRALSPGALLVHAVIVGQAAPGPLANQVLVTIR